MKLVYLDNAATTRVDPQVFRTMRPYFTQKYGNPSEVHSLGRQAKEAVEKSREQVAGMLGCKNAEVIFTGSATESINLSHKGLIEALLPQFQNGRRPHIITSTVEHKAVLETCAHLETLGRAKVTYLQVDKYGMVSIYDVRKEVRPETVLVSVMYVNNEVGTIQPVSQIGRLLKAINHERTHNKPHIYFHTDATQAVQYLDCGADKLGVDLLSFTGHKIYAPKGVGALFVKTGTPLIRQLDGGDQERKLRSGTENVPYIVALGKAVELSQKSKIKRQKEMERLRDKLIKGVLEIPGVSLTGHPKIRAPHLASFIVEGVEGEALQLLLSDKKVIVSTGSACTSQSLTPSHVLSAVGIPAELAHGSLRVSLGKDTTEEEIGYTLKVLREATEKLREMAPDLSELRGAFATI